MTAAKPKSEIDRLQQPSSVELDDLDNPELTEAELSEMRPAREVLPPDLFAALTKKLQPSR